MKPRRLGQGRQLAGRRREPRGGSFPGRQGLPVAAQLLTILGAVPTRALAARAGGQLGHRDPPERPEPGVPGQRPVSSPVPLPRGSRGRDAQRAARGLGARIGPQCRAGVTVASWMGSGLTGPGPPFPEGTHDLPRSPPSIPGAPVERRVRRGSRGRSRCWPRALGSVQSRWHGAWAGLQHLRGPGRGRALAKPESPSLSPLAGAARSAGAEGSSGPPGTSCKCCHLLCLCPPVRPAAHTGVQAAGSPH